VYAGAHHVYLPADSCCAQASKVLDLRHHPSFFLPSLLCRNCRCASCTVLISSMEGRTVFTYTNQIFTPYHAWCHNSDTSCFKAKKAWHKQQSCHIKASTGVLTHTSSTRLQAVHRIPWSTGITPRHQQLIITSDGCMHHV